MNWSRRLWGIEYNTIEKPILIGSLWISYRGNDFYYGEPTRALVFETRKQARAWVKAEPHGLDFRVVRVIETVRKAK